MHVATIESCIHNRTSSTLIILPDEGFYEVEVNVDEEEMKESGDPKGFVQRVIAEHLAECVRETKLPFKENLWLVHFTQEAQAAFNFPEGFLA